MDGRGCRICCSLSRCGVAEWCVLLDVSDLIVCRDVDLCVDWLSVRCLEDGCEWYVCWEGIVMCVD